MKIVVTGGCGYVGSTLIPKLEAIATEIHVLDINSPKPELLRNINLTKTQFHQMDVADESCVRPHVKGATYIIHLAALVGYPACNKAPDLAVRCNVGTTKTILRAKDDSTRVLFSSTCSNYGEQNGLVTETTELNPTSLYGRTKVRGEQLVMRDGKNIVFRFAGGFGSSPNTRDDLLIHDFVSKAVFGIPLSVYESHFVRQFIHVQDMTDALIYAVTNWSKMQGEVFNVGNAKIEITKRQLVEGIHELISFDHKFENSGMDLERRNYPVSFEKVYQAGFTPQVSIERGLADLVEYYKLEKERRSSAIRRQPRAAA